MSVGNKPREINLSSGGSFQITAEQYEDGWKHITYVTDALLLDMICMPTAPILTLTCPKDQESAIPTHYGLHERIPV